MGGDKKPSKPRWGLKTVQETTHIIKHTNSLQNDKRQGGRVDTCLPVTSTDKRPTHVVRHKKKQLAQPSPARATDERPCTSYKSAHTSSPVGSRTSCQRLTRPLQAAAAAVKAFFSRVRGNQSGMSSEWNGRVMQAKPKAKSTHQGEGVENVRASLPSLRTPSSVTHTSPKPPLSSPIRSPLSP